MLLKSALCDPGGFFFRSIQKYFNYHRHDCGKINEACLNVSSLAVAQSLELEKMNRLVVQNCFIQEENVFIQITCNVFAVCSWIGRCYQMSPWFGTFILSESKGTRVCIALNFCTFCTFFVRAAHHSEWGFWFPVLSFLAACLYITVSHKKTWKWTLQITLWFNLSAIVFYFHLIKWQ